AGGVLSAGAAGAASAGAASAAGASAGAAGASAGAASAGAASAGAAAPSAGAAAGAASAGAAAGAASPLPDSVTFNSTRRFSSRPSSVLLSATGMDLPKPLVVMRPSSMQRPTRYFLTEAARATDSFWL